MLNFARAAAMPLALLIAGAADAATVIDFSGLTPGTTFTATTKDQFTVTAATGIVTPGLPFFTDTVGGTAANPNIAFAPGPHAVDVTGAGLFTLGSFVFARDFPADNNVEYLSVTGYLNGVAVYTHFYDASGAASGVVATPAFADEATAVDRVRFYHDGFHSGTLDTINVTAVAVPEPAAWAIMLIGVGMVGSALRRRRVGEMGLPLAG